MGACYTSYRCYTSYMPGGIPAAKSTANAFCVAAAWKKILPTPYAFVSKAKLSHMFVGLQTYEYVHSQPPHVFAEARSKPVVSQQSHPDKLLHENCPSENFTKKFQRILIFTQDFNCRSATIYGYTEKAYERRLYSDRTTKDIAIVDAGVVQDFERAAEAGKEDNFEVLVADAAKHISVSRALPRANFLVCVRDESREVTISEIAVIIAMRQHFKDAMVNAAETAENLTKAVKSKGGKRAIRQLAVLEFFGEGWGSDYIPGNFPIELQDIGIAKAKAMSTPEMVADGTAWAWRLQPGAQPAGVVA